MTLFVVTKVEIDDDLEVEISRPDVRTTYLAARAAARTALHDSVGTMRKTYPGKGRVGVSYVDNMETCGTESVRLFNLRNDIDASHDIIIKITEVFA